MSSSIKKHLYSSLYGIILGAETSLILSTNTEKDSIILGAGIAATVGGYFLMRYIHKLAEKPEFSFTENSLTQQDSERKKFNIKTPQEMQALQMKFTPQKRAELHQKYNLSSY
jgi:hypothetical protein